MMMLYKLIDYYRSKLEALNLDKDTEASTYVNNFIICCFADTIISRRTRKEKQFERASVKQRQEIVAHALKGMVMFMSVLQSLDSAAKSCGLVESLQYLDYAVSFWSGSIEGPNEEGNYYAEGHSIFALAYDFCDTFDTCDATNTDNSKANVQALK